MDEELKVEVYNGGERVGFFFIPLGADMKFLKRNVPYLIRAAQMMVKEKTLGMARQHTASDSPDSKPVRKLER